MVRPNRPLVVCFQKGGRGVDSCKITTWNITRFKECWSDKWNGKTSHRSFWCGRHPDGPSAGKHPNPRTCESVGHFTPNEGVLDPSEWKGGYWLRWWRGLWKALSTAGSWSYALFFSLIRSDFKSKLSVLTEWRHSIPAQRTNRHWGTMYKTAFILVFDR